jgi:hypothetical protein
MTRSSLIVLAALAGLFVAAAPAAAQQTRLEKRGR